MGDLFPDEVLIVLFKLRKKNLAQDKSEIFR